MYLPNYPESRTPTLDDKGWIDLLFHRLQPRISELTFANIFLFRHAHNYRLSSIGDTLVISGTGYDGQPYCLPPIGGDGHLALQSLLDDANMIYGCDREYVERILSPFGPLEVCEDRDSFDYVYLRQDMAELPGNRYHKKKNRVNYFTARHDHAVETFSIRHRDGALMLLDKWAEVRRSIDSKSLDQEVEATREGLEKADILGLEGVVILVSGEVAAFALGEKLNDITSLCHFEKADPFMDGLYQLVDREFNRRCFTGCRFVNKEQDLGEGNLRASKLSYHPVELVEKLRVRRKND